MKNKIIKIPVLIAALTLGFFSHDIIEAIKPAPQQITYCEASISGCQNNGVTIKMDSDVAKAMQPTAINIDWPNQASDTLLVELEGKEMHMGVAKFVLQRDHGNKFTGSLLLPACHSEKMTWIGKVSAPDTPQSIPLLVRMEK
ncbi:hypothetical protein [Vibrio gallicus]|uniref:hypothetical protein n=1 Tax=Vibrio gallicus TaxID=190897 RepID=UPI0021C29238|nr:hypothetical protein [Vibrio gallicus]